MEFVAHSIFNVLLPQWHAHCHTPSSSSIAQDAHVSPFNSHSRVIMHLDNNNTLALISLVIRIHQQQIEINIFTLALEVNL